MTHPARCIRNTDNGSTPFEKVWFWRAMLENEKQKTQGAILLKEPKRLQKKVCANQGAINHLLKNLGNDPKTPITITFKRNFRNKKTKT